MKKLFFFAATMLAAATMSLNAQVWHAVPDDAAVEVKDGDNITTQGAVIAAKGDPVQVGADVFGDKVQVSLQDGGADWVARGNREDGSFTGLDGVTYNKVYAQGGTNGMKGGIDKSGVVSAHVEIVPTVAGTVHIAAKYGYKKSIWAAKVPEAEVEDLVYTEMYKYAIDGFSTLTPGADTTLMYIKNDGSGMMVGQDPAATADVFTTLALEVEPGYTYFFWVEGSKIMLCGINFVAGKEEGIFDATEAVKATKVIENGQVVIIRGDVRYNALGTVIE